MKIKVLVGSAGARCEALVECKVTKINEKSALLGRFLLTMWEKTEFTTTPAIFEKTRFSLSLKGVTS